MKISYGVVLRYKGSTNIYKPYALFDDFENALAEQKRACDMDTNKEFKFEIYKYHGWNKNKTGGGSAHIIKSVLEEIII